MGAPGEAVGTHRAAGAVIVLPGSASGVTTAGAKTWTQDGPGVADSAASDERFGSALAAADLGLDTHADLAIGVPGETVGTRAEAGMVNVLYGAPAGLSAAGNTIHHQDRPGVAEVTDAGDRFGAALAAGDLGNGPRGDLAVGVPGENVSLKAGAGAAAILYGSAAGLGATGNQLWSQDSAGIADAAEAGDGMGAGLQVAAFGAGPGGDLAVGAPGESRPTIAGTGAAHVLYGGPTALSNGLDQVFDEATSSVADTPEPGDAFANALG